MVRTTERGEGTNRKHTICQSDRRAFAAQLRSMTHVGHITDAPSHTELRTRPFENGHGTFTECRHLHGAQGALHDSDDGTTRAASGTTEKDISRHTASLPDAHEKVASIDSSSVSSLKALPT